MITSAFSIQIDPNDMQKVKDMFSDIGKSPTKVFTRALNKTLTGVRTDSSSAIREIITASKSSVDGTFRIEKATENNMRAVIASTGEPLPLIEYSARQTKKGVSVQVKKANPRKVIEGAFIATMKSGHKGVFWRTWHEQVKPKSAYMAYGRLPRRYRLPIEELHGPRVPDIMSNEPVMKSILNQADDRLHKNLMHEMEYELSKHK